MPEEAEFTPEVKFICPFCKGEVMAGHIVEDNEPVVFHEEPTCERFNVLEIDDFLAECRTLFEVDIAKRKPS